MNVAVPSLRLDGLTKSFGGVRALDSFTATIHEGEIRGLIGTNGSGKTTAFNCITGYHRPDAGAVFLGDRDVTGWPVHKRARAGLIRTFQEPISFGGLPVSTNVAIACETVARAGSETRLPSRPPEILDFVGLSGKDRPAASLSFGELRKLSLAVALGARPSVLLMDEPAAGLTESDRGDLADLLRAINAFGVTIVVIEHDMSFLMPLADSVIVLNSGACIFEGSPDEALRDELVIETYLGDGEFAAA